MHGKRGVVAAGLVGLVALSACGSSTGDARDTRAVGVEPVASTSSTRTVKVSATGHARGRPDTMTITIGVSSHGGSAQQALGTNSERATRVIDALKAAGVASDDVQTVDLSIFPTFDTKGRPTGWNASNMVRAKLRQIDKAGAVIDAAAAQAGNDVRFGGVSFSIEDPEGLMAAARSDAMKAARAQANQLAKAAGARLGAVRTIGERTTPGEPVTYGDVAARASGSAATPVEPGSQDLTVDVTVEFLLG